MKNIIYLNNSIHYNKMNIESLQKAGSFHHEIKEKVIKQVKYTNDLQSLCNFIENEIKWYSSNDETNHGIAFPVGLNKNEVVAHYNPLKTEPNIIFDLDIDILKIDYGVHINGNIVDEAFSVTNNPKLFPLMNSSKDALRNMIKELRPDTRICSLGEICEEIVKSYEIEVRPGLFVPVKPINNVTGHTIDPWNIHGNKMVYNINNNSTNIVEENETYALEVYTTDGTGTSMMDTTHISHYSVINNNNKERLNSDSLVFLDYLNTQFRGLAFSPRQINYNNHLELIENLYNNNNIKKYPVLVEPLCIAHVAQFEKTIYVGDSQSIVI